MAHNNNYKYIALIAFLFATSSSAQFLNNLSIGNAKALGLAHAVTADPPSIDSIHYNPAGLVDIQGRRYNLKMLLALFDTSHEIGEPVRPTQATKQTFFDGTQNTQCAGITDINECWGYDPLANTRGGSDDPAAMMPFFGMVELPILAIASGGIAISDEDFGWSYGTAAYITQGVGIRRSEDDPASYQGIEVGLTRFTYFSPTIAIPVTDTFAIGFGLNLSYQGFYMDSKIRAPLEFIRFASTLGDLPVGAIDTFERLSELDPYAPIGRLEMELEDYLSIGMNFGMLWQPYEWLRLGLSYHAESVAYLKGDYTMKNSDSFLGTTQTLSNAGIDSVLILLDGDEFNASRYESGSVEMEYIVPQNLALGVSIQLFPNLKLNLDAKWVEYSAWDSLDFEFSNKVDYLILSSVINTLRESKVGNNADPATMRLRREYKDVWSFAMGVEYDLTHRWVLRAGYEPRTSVIPDESTDLFMPLGDLELYTVGFGYQWSATSRIDAAFAYGVSKVESAACQSRNANSCIEGDVLYNPYFSMPFESETEVTLFTISYESEF